MTAVALNSKIDNHLNNLSHDFKSSLDNYLQYEKGSILLNDRYSFLNNLQTGSFGKVTCALDTASNNKVAIKALKKSVSGVTFMARHETSIMKKLGYHPNICQLVESFETKKYFILVLEYVPCGDLYDAVHNKTTLGTGFQNDPRMFSSLCSQLYNVIKYSHSLGIYHRDIKPENILLMEDGTIKLCDWGLASKSIKCTDFNVGTEKYMAPEALGKHNQDDYYLSTNVDVWSVAITLLYTLFNKCPFRKALPSDLNYLNFLKSKAFLYDFYTNMNSITFQGIVDKLMLQRDLDGAMKILVDDGVNNGYTLDQEYTFELTQKQSDMISSIVNSNGDSDQLGGEFFLFEDLPSNEENNNNNNDSNNIKNNNSSNNNDIDREISLFDKTNHNHISNLEPMVISSSKPITIQNFHGSPSCVADSFNAPNSLFDKQPESFINSFNTIGSSSANNYLNTGNLSWCDDNNDFDFDNYVLGFENIMKH